MKFPIRSSISTRPRELRASNFLQSLKLFGSTAPSSVDDRTLSEGAVQDAGRDVRSEAASDRGEVASHEHEPVFYSPLECTLAASKQASSPTAQWAGVIDHLPGIKKDEVGRVPRRGLVRHAGIQGAARKASMLSTPSWHRFASCSRLQPQVGDQQVVEH